MIAITSGTFAAIGNSEVDGVKVAISQLNANGGILGRQVQLYVQDEGSSFSTSQVVGAAQILINQNHVDFLICCTFSGDASSVQPLVIQNKIVDICVECSANSVVSAPPGNKYLFTVSMSDQGFTGFMLAWLHIIGARSFAYIGEDFSFVHETAGFLKNDSAAEGVNMVMESYFPGSTTDFTSLINQIASAKPDAVINYVTGTEALDFQRQYAANPTTAKIPELQAASLLVESSFAQSLQSSAPGAINGLFAGEQNTITNITNTYVSQLHLTRIASFGYDAMKFLSLAIQKAGTTNTDSVVAAIYQVDYVGVSGHINMQTDHTPRFGIGYLTGTIYQWSVVNGNLKIGIVWPPSVANATATTP